MTLFSVAAQSTTRLAQQQRVPAQQKYLQNNVEAAFTQDIHHHSKWQTRFIDTCLPACRAHRRPAAAPFRPIVLRPSRRADSASSAPCHAATARPQCSASSSRHLRDGSDSRYPVTKMLQPRCYRPTLRLVTLLAVCKALLRTKFVKLFTKAWEEQLHKSHQIVQ